MATDQSKFKFTKTAVDALPFTMSRNERKEYRDTEVNGLTLRVGMESKVYYLIKYDPQTRKQVKSKLGSYLDLTPLTAREQALKLLQRAGKSGGISAAKTELEHNTLEKLWTKYEEKHLRVHIKESAQTIYTWAYNKHIKPRFGSRDPASIARREVLDLFKSVSEGSKANGDRVLTVIASIYTFAMNEGILDDNPAHMIKRNPTVRKSRRLDKDSMPGAVRKIAEFPQLYRVPFMLFLLLGQRRSETALMEWSEVNERDWVWTIPGDDILGYKKGKTKNGQTHTVPLPPWSRELILSMKPHTGTESHVFHCSGHAWNKTSDGPIKPSSLTQFLAKQFDQGKMGNVPKFTIHDLRRTAYTQIASLTDSLEQTKRVFNHIVDAGASQHYDYHHYNGAKLKALTLWEERLRAWIS